MKNPKLRIPVLAGGIAGVAADALLRVLSGSDGNLLVHSAVFLLSGAAFAGMTAAVLLLVEHLRKKRKR